MTLITTYSDVNALNESLNTDLSSQQQFCGDLNLHLSKPNTVYFVESEL